MAQASRPPTRFVSLATENWKNFRAVDVALPRRVFLVGANASGKSNFLDVFRFLHDIASVGGGFQAAVGKRGGVSRIRCLAARRYPDVAVRVTLGGPEGVPTWTYELGFTQDNRRRPVITRERVVRDGTEILSRPDSDDRRDPERRFQTYLEQVNANRRFRDVAAFLQTVRYLHIVPQLVRDPDRSIGRHNDPFGGDFLEQVALTAENVQKSRLRRIRDALRVAVPQLRELELRRDERGTPHLHGLYEHWRPLAGWQTEEQFSDGTLRLMGLLWAILDGSGPLLLEEPELSLHPEVVRRVAQLIARAQRNLSRQVILSTHSTDLLLDRGIGPNEVLVLFPGKDGTDIKQASNLAAMRELSAGGMPVGEVVMPHTRPADADQLPLFGEARRARKSDGSRRKRSG